MLVSTFRKLIIPLVLILLHACSDAWDEHYYSAGNSGDGSISLYESIKANPDLSSFATLLERTGLDSTLQKPITYTVWAPVNSPAMDSLLNTDDLPALRNTMLNHISRFSYPTAGLSVTTIFLLNKKFVQFKREPQGFAYGGKLLLPAQSNISASNGILHLIEAPVPYMTNLWEFILRAEGIDSLRQFLDAQSIYAFDPRASIEIGTNEFGQSVYDSVILFSNEVLERIGALHIEDSTYSILLPDNHAWTVAYNAISGKYKTMIQDGGAAKQRLRTQNALVNNLVFRQLNPLTADSIVSTTGSIFQQPGYLFDGATQIQLSNGKAFITDSLRYHPSESWQQSIKVEAENANYGRSFLFANLFVRSGLGSPYSATTSESRYLLVEPTTVSTTQQASVTFPIPNTLSGKYRMYCVFLPSDIVSEGDTRPYKVRFYVTHLTSNGTVVENSPIGAQNQLQATNRTAAIFTSTASQISKMFVTEIEFPFCNILEPNAASSTITTRLRVENAVTAVEEIQRRGDRKMRIDYIILEPVP